MSKVDDLYKTLLLDIMSKGTDKDDRTGVGTRSVFGRMTRFDVPNFRLPMLTCKSVHFKSVLHELLWFFSGSDNIKYLVDNGVSIWNEWPYDVFKRTQDELRDSPLVTSSFFSVTNIQEFAQRIKDDAKFAEMWGMSAAYTVVK